MRDWQKPEIQEGCLKAMGMLLEAGEAEPIGLMGDVGEVPAELGLKFSDRLKKLPAGWAGVRCSEGFHPHQPHPLQSPAPSSEFQVGLGSRGLYVSVRAPEWLPHSSCFYNHLPSPTLSLVRS